MEIAFPFMANEIIIINYKIIIINYKRLRLYPHYSLVWTKIAIPTTWWAKIVIPTMWWTELVIHTT